MTREAETALTALIELMARLRNPRNGCPWDIEQTFATVAPYTIEEAYEVADAIEQGHPAKIRDELGDLLFQVVFHARMAEERGWFDFAAVARSIHEKLVRRHPHVFGGATADDSRAVLRNWEDLKAQERAQAAAEAGHGAGRSEGESARGAKPSILADVPKALPALARAAKLGRRAARVGFDWTEPQQVREKVLEEIREIDAAPAPELAEEIGDLLFSVANWSRHLHIDPEEALRAANSKFEKRFREMERLAAARGADVEKLGAAEWDALWREAKHNNGG
jgi:ATP diphosphatase